MTHDARAENQTDRDASAGHVARVALLGALATLIVKLTLWALTGSAAVLGDALESLVNILAAAVALFCLWYAARPADREHPYGHGKMEFVASMVEGLLVVLAGVGIAVEAVRRLLGGHELQRVTLGIVSMLVIAGALFAFGRWIRRRGQALHSATLTADGRHLMTDAASTLGVAGALIVVRFTGWVWVDPAAALVICLLVLWTGSRLMKAGLDGLMDRIDVSDDAAIRAILDEAVAAGRITDYHAVRHRHQGAYHWVDMHIQVEPTMTVEQAHQTATELERRIQDQLGDANATAHIEPSHATEDQDTARFPW